MRMEREFCLTVSEIRWIEYMEFRLKVKQEVEEKDMRNLIQIKGMGCSCCL